MTDETIPKIRPRIDEDGEAWCATGCPSFAASPWPVDCGMCTVDGPCVPMLRRQRDEARAELERLREKEDWVCPQCRTVFRYSSAQKSAAGGFPVCPNCTTEAGNNIILTPLTGFRLSEAEAERDEAREIADAAEKHSDILVEEIAKLEAEVKRLQEENDILNGLIAVAEDFAALAEKE